MLCTQRLDLFSCMLCKVLAIWDRSVASCAHSDWDRSVACGAHICCANSDIYRSHIFSRSFIFCHIAVPLNQVVSLRPSFGSMAAQLVSHLQALGSFMKQIKNTPSFADVCSNQRSHYSQQLSTMTLSIQEASQVADALKNMPWGAGVLESMLQELAEKTAVSAPNPKGSKTNPQDYRSVPSYFTNDHWAMLKGSVSSMRKLEAIVGHAIRLGLKVPSEPTFQVITALYIASTNSVAPRDMASADKYQMLQYIKKVFKKAVGKTVVSCLCITELPAEVDGFRTKHSDTYKEAFGDSEPCECQFDEVLFSSLIASVPMRNTNQMVKGASDSGSSQQSQLVQMMQTMMQQCMPRMQQPDLDIRFLQSPRQQSLQSPPQAALCDAIPLQLRGVGGTSAKEEIPLQFRDDGGALAKEACGGSHKCEDVAEDVTSASVSQSGVATTSGELKPAKRQQRFSIEEATRLIESQIVKRDALKPGPKQAAKGGNGKGATGKGAGKGKSKGVGKGKGLKVKAELPDKSAKGGVKVKAEKVKAETVKAEKVKAEKVKLKRKATYSIEWSRSQIVLRSVQGANVAFLLLLLLFLLLPPSAPTSIVAWSLGVDSITTRAHQ